MFKNNKKMHRLMIALLVLGLLVCLCMTFASAAGKAREDADAVVVTSAEPAADTAVAVDEKGATSNAEALTNFLDQTGIMMIIHNIDWKSLIMIVISFVLLFLAIGKGFEPLLLLPIAFGMLLTNLPGAGMYHTEIFINETGHINWEAFSNSDTFGSIPA